MPNTYFLSYDNENGDNLDLIVRASSPANAYAMWLAYFDDCGLIDPTDFAPHVTMDDNISDDCIRIFEMVIQDAALEGALSWHGGDQPNHMVEVAYVEVR